MNYAHSPFKKHFKILPKSGQRVFRIQKHTCMSNFTIFLDYVHSLFSIIHPNE